MDTLRLAIEGHVLIRDPDTNEIIVNKRNAIHKENMVFALASLISTTIDSNSNSAFIQSLAFGNGGVIVDGSGNITYRSVNAGEVTDTLYNQTYSKVVNFDEDVDSDNNIKIVNTTGTAYTDIVVTSTLDYGEPQGQDAYDDASTLQGDFVFDEIGLVSQQGRSLSHLIFHPVQKSANRRIQVVYTVRILAT